jgi:hypothetical protein
MLQAHLVMSMMVHGISTHCHHCHCHQQTEYKHLPAKSDCKELHSCCISRTCSCISISDAPPAQLLKMLQTKWENSAWCTQAAIKIEMPLSQQQRQKINPAPPLPPLQQQQLQVERDMYATCQKKFFQWNNLEPRFYCSSSWIYHLTDFFTFFLCWSCKKSQLFLLPNFCSALCGLSICLQQLTYAIKSAALAQTGVFRYMDFCMYVNFQFPKWKKQKFRKLVFYFSG